MLNSNLSRPTTLPLPQHSLHSLYGSLDDAAPLADVQPGSTARRRLNVDLDWQFCAGQAGSTEMPTLHEDGCRSVTLPHNWQTEEDSPIGWYRRELSLSALDKGCKIMIELDGVFGASSVWINGHLLGNRASGYLGIGYDITRHVRFTGTNLLVIRVERTEQTIPALQGDGLCRSAWLLKMDPLHVMQWGVGVDGAARKDGKVELCAMTMVHNEHRTAKTATLFSMLLDGEGRVQATAASAFRLEPDERSSLQQYLTLEGQELWSAAMPGAYRLLTQIQLGGRVIDRYETAVDLLAILYDADRSCYLMKGTA